MARTALHISLTLSLLLSLVSCTTESLILPRGEVSVAYLWSLSERRSVTIKRDIYIVGYVVANDRFGEKNNALVIDDGSGGIELKVEGTNIDRDVPLFSRVRLRCSGLNIGREGGKTVIGKAPTAEYVVDRIAEGDLLNYLTIIDNHDTMPEGERLTADEISSNKMLRYVALSNMLPIAEERGMTWCDTTEQSTEQYQTTVRHFCDLSDTLHIVTDGRCSYAGEELPDARCTLQGLLDWHDGDIALRLSSHQVFK